MPSLQYDLDREGTYGSGKPAYLSPVSTPAYPGRTMTRVTGDPGTTFTHTSGSGTWGMIARHHYSKDQAWNSDQTLIAIDNSGSPASTNIVFLNATTFLPQYVRCASYSRGDDRWHPTQPHIRINVNGTYLQWWDVTTCTETKHINLGFTADYIGQAEGNVTANGRYVALTNAAGTSMYLVDMQTDTVGSAINIVTGTGLPSSTVVHSSISPSGAYIAVGYSGDHHAIWDTNLGTLTATRRVYPPTMPDCAGYDPALGIIWDVGHADMGVNPFNSNKDVIVGQRRSTCSSLLGTELGRIVMVDLDTGDVTGLTNPVNEASPHHVSMQAVDRPGWAYASYFRTAGKTYSGEVIAVKLDGSKTVERYGLTHSTDTPYDNEPHCVPRRDGTQVLCASAWDDLCAPCGNTVTVQDYVIR